MQDEPESPSRLEYLHGCHRRTPNPVQGRERTGPGTRPVTSRARRTARTRTLRCRPTTTTPQAHFRTIGADQGSPGARPPTKGRRVAAPTVPRRFSPAGSVGPGRDRSTARRPTRRPSRDRSRRSECSDRSPPSATSRSRWTRCEPWDRAPVCRRCSNEGARHGVAALLKSSRGEGVSGHARLVQLGSLGVTPTYVRNAHLSGALGLPRAALTYDSSASGTVSAWR